MDIPPEATKALPGAAGSLTALIFVKGEPVTRMIGMGVAGAFAAWYGGETLARVSHMDEPLAGYVAGVISIALFRKAIELIENINVGGINLGEFINGFLGKRNKPE